MSDTEAFRKTAIEMESEEAASVLFLNLISLSKEDPERVLEISKKVMDLMVIYLNYRDMEPRKEPLI